VRNDEWAGICTLLENGWPGEFGDAARVSYRLLLDDFDPAQIEQALKLLVRSGGTFRPSASEVAGAITADPSTPTFTEALRDLRRALAVRQSYFAKDDEKERVCVEWLEQHSHELVARFFEAQSYGRLSQLPIDDPDYGQLEVKRLREDWDAFTDAPRTAAPPGCRSGRAHGGGSSRRTSRTSPGAYTAEATPAHWTCVTGSTDPVGDYERYFGFEASA
jgi:hypothetical protein